MWWRDMKVRRSSHERDAHQGLSWFAAHCVVSSTDEVDYRPGGVRPPAHHHKWVFYANIVEQFTSQTRTPAKTTFSFPIQFLWSSDIANVQLAEERDRIFLFFLFFLRPFSAHCPVLPQGGACQHPSGLNLPLVQILSLVCSHKCAVRSARRLGLIPDLRNMERSRNEGLSLQFLSNRNSPANVKDPISQNAYKPPLPWQQGSSGLSCYI